MLQNHSLSNAALLSGNGTSAHETGILLFGSNRLRVWNAATGIRRRRVADGQPLRAKFIQAFLSQHPEVRRVKVHDSGVEFTVCVYMRTGKRIRRKAYSLDGLWYKANQLFV